MCTCCVGMTHILALPITEYVFKMADFKYYYHNIFLFYYIGIL